MATEMMSNGEIVGVLLEVLRIIAGSVPIAVMFIALVIGYVIRKCLKQAMHNSAVEHNYKVASSSLVPRD